MKKLITVLLSALLLLLLPNTAGDEGKVYAQECTELTDNMVITQDTTFCAGSYSFMDKEADGVIIIGADNITVDGNGLILDGKNKSGYGIYVNGNDIENGYNGVTLRNFNITRYFHAIRIEKADSLLVENNAVSNNGGKGEQFYDINRSPASAYGGGIFVDLTTNSTFDNNVGDSQNVGIDMYNSSGNTISNSDFSNNFGWGIRLYDSDSNAVSNNRADHVHGCRGAFCSARDTAGILLVIDSNGNTISGNSIIDGGDGFFIGNEHGLPSNNNLIENNDASAAIHNAFEATFSEGNIFRGNTASNSNYGFWLGFSHHSTVENNTIQNNQTDGIHWEHGRFGTLSDNDISGNGRYGLALTLNPDNALINDYPGSEESHDHTISGNTVADNGQYGLYFLNTTTSTVQSNVVAGNNINLYFDGDSINNAANQNDILCTSASGNTCQYSAYNNMSTGKDVNAEDNWWGTDVEDEIEALVFHYPDDNSKGLIDYDPWVGSTSDPNTDIAIAAVSAPSSVVQGDAVSIDVTVENVGNQDVTSDINVALRDDTDGVTIGTQTVSGGLTAGASATLTFSWDTSSASPGDHTLTASHDFADDDSTNDSRSTVVTVEAAVTDIAVTTVSAPSSVVQGDAVNVDVTVENVGNQDVSSDINVTLTDDTDGVTIGTHTISGGLAAGASTTLTLSWDTSEASIGDHTLTASHDFADDDATNDSKSTTITVNETATTMHVGDLDGTSTNQGSTWTANVTIAIHDSSHNPVASATVSGTWSGGASGTVSCTTDDSSGECTVSQGNIHKRNGSVTFSVDDVTHSTLSYDSTANHDPDGDSNGTSITVAKP